jgi:hypothetical protein
MFRSSLAAGCILTLTLTSVAAQQPTQAQRDAIRASRPSDFMANCASVQPGGKEALECLLRNESKLSAPCRSAVNAIAIPASNTLTPASAATAPAASPSGASSPAPSESSMPAAAAPPSPKTSHSGSSARRKPPDTMRRTSAAAALGPGGSCGARGGAAWTDSPDAAAASADDSRAVPPRSATIMRRSAGRRRPDLRLPCRQCAAIVANLLRRAGAGERIRRQAAAAAM